jgi:predicted aspartyl protease
MTISVTYDGSHAFRQTQRPYADIYCHGITGRIPSPQHVGALIDTGADHLELPNKVARQLGINLGAFPSQTISTAGGYISVTVVRNFSVEIEKKLVQVTAHFLPITTALLGLRAVLAAIDLGFDISNWLYDL